MLPVLALILAALILAPLGARAADLVVWWEKGYNPEEDGAVRETVAAFELKSGEKVDLSFHVQMEMASELQAALDAKHPPDLAYSVWAFPSVSRWAYEGRLVDLADAIEPLRSLFDQEALDRYNLLDSTTSRRGLFGLAIASAPNSIHVWTSLLGQAGLGLADVPKQWDAFWSFWCDRVQSALRRATGRDDVWGVGLTMHAGTGEWYQFNQFLHAYDADYVTRDGRLVIEDPEIRQRIIAALTGYTAIWRKGCTPPDSLEWMDPDNNKAFLAGRVVMTINSSLSIPNALRKDRPDDYYKNTRTIEWPLGPRGNPIPNAFTVIPVLVFREGNNIGNAKMFTRFLVQDLWLAHWADFAGDRYMPTLSALLDQPFWLDPTDPHRMPAAIQYKTQPLDYDYAAVSGNWRHSRVYEERVWQKAIHSIAAEGVSPEQAADVAIARVKQILGK
jgi:multiple sugar transport system substrate-binding protein